MQPVSQDILFDSAEGAEVRLRISANGSVWFRTLVSEDVIDRVYDELQRFGAP